MILIALLLDFIGLGLAIKGYVDLIHLGEITNFIPISYAFSVIATIIICTKHKEINL